VLEYSHRDRRAEREVDRSFLTVVGLTLAFVMFALVVPVPFAGWVGVVALGALGVAYVTWSERFLERYSEDRRVEQEGGSPDGFLRAELRSPARPDREGGWPTARSPHVRRRATGSRVVSNDSPPPPGAETDHR
jgi:hypothetical protein